MPVYLDCNATTPLDPAVRDAVMHYLCDEFGNEGSRTHEYGARAKKAVQLARDQVANVVRASRDEVVFTSGATESNNLAILGLREYGLKANRRHIITSLIEHKAVLEPLNELQNHGFHVDLLPVDSGGTVDLKALRECLRPDTLLVSIMHVNNETGVMQPLPEIAEILGNSDAYFHTDAAQGFGKSIEALQNNRIDLISVSGHKIYGPKGIGALITRKRGFNRAPLSALMFGGGQERGLRPGTLAVPLVAGLGVAAEIALRDVALRRRICRTTKDQIMESLEPVKAKFIGDQAQVLDHVLNVSFTGIDSEALIVGLKDQIAISNGSACTSASYAPSHVLKAMGMTDDEANSCVRISWSHLTPPIDWRHIAARIRLLQ